jgi:hypothetical protein
MCAALNVTSITKMTWAQHRPSYISKFPLECRADPKVRNKKEYRLFIIRPPANRLYAIIKIQKIRWIKEFVIFYTWRHLQMRKNKHTRRHKRCVFSSRNISRRESVALFQKSIQVSAAKSNYYCAIYYPAGSLMHRGHRHFVI